MKKLPLSCVPIGAVGFVDCVADISSKNLLNAICITLLCTNMALY